MSPLFSQVSQSVPKHVAGQVPPPPPPPPPEPLLPVQAHPPQSHPSASLSAQVYGSTPSFSQLSQVVPKQLAGQLPVSFLCVPPCSFASTSASTEWGRERTENSVWGGWFQESKRQGHTRRDMAFSHGGFEALDCARTPTNVKASAKRRCEWVRFEGLVECTWRLARPRPRSISAQRTRHVVIGEDA